MIVGWIICLSGLILYSKILARLYRGLSLLQKTASKLPHLGFGASSSLGLSPLTPPTTPKFISLLVAARNEEQDLPLLLEDLKNQNYPEEFMEWIIIDDRSNDQTAHILAEFAKTHPQTCKIVTIVNAPPAGISPKKNALSQGFAHSQGEIIASTDADCRLKPDWFASLNNAFQSSTSPNNQPIGMVLGLTLYQKKQEINPLFLEMQNLEFFGQGLVSASLVAGQFPINGNANNMAYNKEAYISIGGIQSHQHITSGDDDFLLQKIHAEGKYQIRFLTHPASQVLTRPCQTLREFWEQRKRWASKTGMYSPDRVFFLKQIFLHFCLLVGIALYAFLNCQVIFPAILLWGHKILGDLLILKKGIKIFSLHLPFRTYALAALLHPPLIIAIVIFGQWGSFKWKGQKSIRGKNV